MQSNWNSILRGRDIIYDMSEEQLWRTFGHFMRKRDAGQIREKGFEEWVGATFPPDWKGVTLD